MQIAVQGLSLSVGYRDDWQASVANPTPDRMRLFKEAARLAMRHEYGWLNGPPCDVAAYKQVVLDLEAGFNTGDGRLGDAEARACCVQLVKCKQPPRIEGEFDLERDPYDQFGLCMPNPKPPPFTWVNRGSYNLIKPNGKRASVSAVVGEESIKVKLVVCMTWENPEV